MLPELTKQEVLRYSRHMFLPEVGMEGQQKLKAASVLVIGTGGLGSPVSLYLAAGGVGRIGIVDYDVVELSNLQRQVLHGTRTLRVPKVESARQRMLDLNPEICVEAHNILFNAETGREIAADYDILVDGTDNFPTRYLINDLAVMTKKPYVYGSIFRFEGQLSVFDARVGPCYRCLFPEPPPPGSVPACGEAGVFGAVPGTIGTMQAAEVVKLILGVGQPLIGKLLLYDAIDMSFHTVQLRKNPRCKVCSPQPEITELIDYEAFCGMPAHDRGIVPTHVPDIAPDELAGRLTRGEDILLLDIREAIETQISRLPGSIQISLDQLPRRLHELDRNREIVVYCRIGVRSARAVGLMQQAGFSRVRNLRGGINAWADQVDPTMYRY
ncbi:MAG: molybdopterin-synthase adenylyltransferase MoeB [Anaerolineaceae bacterium]|jgi:adenylyltransferase/sulfurtransferase